MFESKICNVIKITRAFICLIFTGLVLLKDIYQPNIQRQLLLISVTIITIDLDTFFNSKEDVAVVQKDKGPESTSNITRNLILLGLFIGCMLLVGAFIDGHAEPIEDLSKMSVPQLPATADERLLLNVFGQQSTENVVHFERYCRSLFLDFYSVTKVLYLNPGLKAVVLEAMNKEDTKELTQAMVMIRTLAEDV